MQKIGASSQRRAPAKAISQDPDSWETIDVDAESDVSHGAKAGVPASAADACFFYSLDGEVQQQATLAEAKTLAEQGVLQDDTLVFYPGLEQWEAFGACRPAFLEDVTALLGGAASDTQTPAAAQSSAFLSMSCAGAAFQFSSGPPGSLATQPGDESRPVIDVEFAGEFMQGGGEAGPGSSTPAVDEAGVPASAADACFFYSLDGEVQQQATLAEAKTLAEQGVLQDDTLVFYPGLEQWEAFGACRSAFLEDVTVLVAPDDGLTDILI